MHIPESEHEIARSIESDELKSSGLSCDTLCEITKKIGSKVVPLLFKTDFGVNQRLSITSFINLQL